MAKQIDDEDLILYALLGAAVVYFLYKNNVFGAPAAATSPGLPALPAPSPPSNPTVSANAAAAAPSSTATPSSVIIPSTPFPADSGITDIDSLY
jgi:hypothetical protein